MSRLLEAMITDTLSLKAIAKIINQETGSNIVEVKVSKEVYRKIYLEDPNKKSFGPAYTGMDHFHLEGGFHIHTNVK